MESVRDWGLSGPAIEAIMILSIPRDSLGCCLRGSSRLATAKGSEDNV